jgi:magnesium-transporting ATPase (P-type)
MITGDNKDTAQSIGREINIIDEMAFSKSSYTGAEFETFSDIRQDEIMMDSIKEFGGLIFSRTEPRHKKMLVRSLSNLVIRKMLSYNLESNCCNDR